MAQLYDFNPVKGNVKEIRSVVYNKDKSINYESLLKIGRDGCIDSFALNQKRMNTSVVYIIISLLRELKIN